MSEAELPRGIRNANPGNVRVTGIRWQGQIDGPDPSFCTFSAPVYGLRIIMLLMRNYYNLRDLTTIRKLVSRWAPPVENNTDAYAADVAKCMNIGPDNPLTLDDVTCITFAESIVLHENGMPPEGYPPYWYETDLYRQAYGMLPGCSAPAAEADTLNAAELAKETT